MARLNTSFGICTSHECSAEVPPIGLFPCSSCHRTPLALSRVVPREARTCAGGNLARAVRDDATTQPATSHQSSTPHASITKQAMTPVSEPSDRMLFGSTADSPDPCGMITGSNGKCKSGSGTGFVPGR
ncbi:hypothetical protein BS50DRAFT_359108 [Corynespora cassiicola Philippines]|uniref:Uncharacterized protein n=1 Tax=Corynespora cassiicola Philippines TaxID=1448308 RepID=A0A2T2NS35_CORCC|nr:hypothetical protein BS50DRAFT_359108 [Corynespora cassiicola Philippines]